MPILQTTRGLNTVGQLMNLLIPFSLVSGHLLTFVYTASFLPSQSLCWIVWLYTGWSEVLEISNPVASTIRLWVRLPTKPPGCSSLSPPCLWSPLCQFLSTMLDLQIFRTLMNGSNQCCLFYCMSITAVIFFFTVFQLKNSAVNLKQCVVDNRYCILFCISAPFLVNK